jgi:hypothetical protein
MDSYNCHAVYAAVTIPDVNKRFSLYATDRRNFLRVTVMVDVAVAYYRYLNDMTHNALNITV